MPVADQANGAARQALGFSSSTAWAEIVGGPNQRITSESVELNRALGEPRRSPDLRRAFRDLAAPGLRLLKEPDKLVSQRVVDRTGFRRTGLLPSSAERTS